MARTPFHLLVPTHAEAAHLRRHRPTVTGPGSAAVVAALEHIARTDPGAAVVLAGFAGGLNPALPVGHVLRPTTVSHAHGRATTLAHGDGTTIVSVEHVVATPAAKAALRAATAADAVDLESHAAAVHAAALGLRFTVLRAISDDAATALPPPCATWVTPAGRTRVLRVLVWALPRPSRLAALRQLQRDAAAAGRTLAAALDALDTC